MSMMTAQGFKDVGCGKTSAELASFDLGANPLRVIGVLSGPRPKTSFNQRLEAFPFVLRPDHQPPDSFKPQSDGNDRTNSLKNSHPIGHPKNASNLTSMNSLPNVLICDMLSSTASVVWYVFHDLHLDMRKRFRGLDPSQTATTPPNSSS
ncbi:hypothetical protein PtB15_14B496 [Puccinia triticina]|nr:hypothetical protein PtB15_14B496 [Puccinia triticina]